MSSLVWCQSGPRGGALGRLLSSSIDGSVSEWDLFDLRQRVKTHPKSCYAFLRVQLGRLIDMACYYCAFGSVLTIIEILKVDIGIHISSVENL